MDDRLDPTHTRFEEVAGIRTRVYERGEGEPLVLVHGGQFGELYSLDSWSLLLPHLSRFRALAFDRVGQGHTGLPPHDDYTIEAVVRHAVAAVELLSPEPAHLVGHSRGAFVAARVALERPDLVRSLVVVDSNTLAPDDPRFPTGAFYAEIERRLPAGPPSAESVRLEPDAQSVSVDHVTDDFLARLLAIARLDTTREAAARMRELRESVWTPGLDRLRRETIEWIDREGLPVPTLVVWGRDDPSAPLPLAHALYDRIAARTPRAELHVFAPAGHYVYREQPRGFAAALASFCI